MMRAKCLSLSGWGRFPVYDAPTYRPERVKDLRDIVACAPQKRVISRGLGRSYGDACINDRGDAVILHERLGRMLHWDPATGLLRAQAGVSLEQILEVFLPRGLFLPVTPGTKFVTLGGAVAADVHGKNHHRDGSFASCIHSFTLLTAGGDVLECSREQNPELFWATVGGMGLTGIIIDVTIRLMTVETAYVRVDYQRAENLDAALAGFGTGDQNYQYSVAWIDCLAKGASLGRSVLIRGNHAPLADLPDGRHATPLTLRRRRRSNSVPFNMPGWILNSLSVKAFNAVFYRTHKDGSDLVDYDTFFFPLDGVLHWNRIYGKRGFVQYQTVFPAATARAGLVALLERITASRRASFLAVLKTMGPGNSAPLSFPFEGQTLSLDIKNTGADLLEFLKELDRIVLKHGGRVYLAKDARMSGELIPAMYPRIEEFRQIKARLDPQDRFESALSKRLRLGGGA